MSLMVNDNQLGLAFDQYEQYTRPSAETISAALNDTSPTPVHRGDPPTAVDAAIAAALRAPSMRRRVLFALVAVGEHGATDFELSERLEILRTSAGKRRKELADLGLVRLSGIRRPTDTTTPASVWKITDEGKAIAAELRKEGKAE